MLHAANLSKFKAFCTDWAVLLWKSRIKNNIPYKLFVFKITLSGRQVRGRKTTQGNHSFIMRKVKNPFKISRQSASRTKKDRVCKVQLCMCFMQKQEYFHLVILCMPQKWNRYSQQRLWCTCKPQCSFVQGQFLFLILIILKTAVQLIDTVKE